MCNLVHGEALAFGDMSNFHEIGEIPDVPCSVEKKPLIPRRRQEIARLESPFDGLGFLHITGIPEGREVEVVSKLSALLSRSINNDNVIVDLNYYLPHSMPKFTKVSQTKLSKPAKNWASRIRNYTNSHASSRNPPIAIIDSGVTASTLRGRTVQQLDFSEGEDGNGISTLKVEDRRGHGTKVGIILDQTIPKHVPIVSAKIGDSDKDVTVLNLARAFAETVVTYTPAVVNISLAPFDDTFTCPNCSEKVKVPAFHARILRRVFSFADTTFVVMAAGNEGQTCNERHSDSKTENLVFAVAVDSSLSVAGYSSYPVGEDSQYMTAYAFGGDDPDDEKGFGVFESDRDTFGTSFAAPFVSAAVYPIVAWLLDRGLPIDRKSVFNQWHKNDGSGWMPEFISQNSGLWRIRPWRRITK